MTTPRLFHDAGHCLRAAAPPLLALAVLAATRSMLEEATLASLDGFLLLSWRAAIVASALWLGAATCWAATRPLRDHRAYQRLQHLRHLAAQPDRALVHIQTAIWTTTASQHAVVLNIATGVRHRVWLPETAVPVGAFVVLERTGSGVGAVSTMKSNHVEAAHRWERHHPSKHATSVSVGGCSPTQDESEDARTLVEETEQFLRDRG